MPRPEAVYIPEPVRAYAKKQGLTISELSEELGHSYNWIYRIFRSEQELITPYIKVANEAGITLDELILIIEQKQSAAVVTKLRNGGSLYAVSKKLKVSEAFLRGLSQNSGKLNALKSLVHLARSIKCNVSELVTGSEIAELTA